MSKIPGMIYVVATPIGNLGDMTPRAIEVLGDVNIIAAEDTRHSRKLLEYFEINTKMISLHDYNEEHRATELIDKVIKGDDIALISDAGTPLISDPGYKLIALAHEQNLKVCPIPGPAAVIAALSTEGLPTDKFIFEGFLAAKSSNRRSRFNELLKETRTIVFYEAPHRIVEFINDAKNVFGDERVGVIARELTKQFETIKMGTLSELCEWIESDPNQQRGEFVVMLHGTEYSEEDEVAVSGEHVLRVLLKEVSQKKAVELAVDITGLKKNALYKLALALNDDKGDD